MGFPFTDITIYASTPHKVGTPEYYEEVAVQNFISDLYVQKMYGYKPPKTSRVILEPSYHKIWNRTWKTGSIVAIAPFFSYDQYKSLDKKGKYQYILDLIQVSMLQLSDEYGWDKSVFEKAYSEIVDNDFKFKVAYPSKMSRDKRKLANLTVAKTETITSIFVEIENGDTLIKVKLFDKSNTWCYDCVYYLARCSKWFDTDRFGISYGKGKIDIWYSIENKEIAFFENGTRVTEINFSSFFLFQQTAANTGLPKAASR